MDRGNARAERHATLDAGAVTALRAGESLLPAGDQGRRPFARGDAVMVRGPDTSEIGRGLSPTTPRTPTRSRAAPPGVMAILGISGRSEMIHRDDLVVGG